jgi:hypothetical protein
MIFTVVKIPAAIASRIICVLLAVIGVLGALILALDNILWGTAPVYAYGLIFFVIIDFAAGALVLARPSKAFLTLAAAWSASRIIVQLGDVSLAPSFGLTYAQFADYLFNPAATNPRNLTGIPGALIDLILILQIIVIWTALRGRSSINKG